MSSTSGQDRLVDDAPGAERSGGRGRQSFVKSLAVWLLAGVLLTSCSGGLPSGARPTPTQSPTDPPLTLPAPSPSATVASLPTPSPDQSPTENSTTTPTPRRTPVPGASLAQLIGQKLIVAMAGTMPDADLLGRIRRGEVGGVILFGSNIRSASQLRALTAALRSAAAAGGQPRLLIAVDQEGGGVERIPWIGPTLSPPSLGQLDDPAVALAQGTSTGTALRQLGIDVDLAPVVDVPTVPDSFIAAQGRAFSSSPTVVADMGVAFARGLLGAGVLPVLKHFPGLGLATSNTDVAVVTIGATTVGLSPGLVPYRAAFSQGLPLVMLSNATYPVWDADAGAGWSAAIGSGLLRGQLGFHGATMTDSLDGTATARGVPVARLAIAAAVAGTDLILLTGSEASSRDVFAALLGAADAGRIPRQTLEASSARILTLKGRA